MATEALRHPEQEGSAAPEPQTEVKGLLGTLVNAALLLELMSQGPPVQTVTSLAQQSGLSLATTHRLLRSLTQAGLARQSARSHGYGLGPGLVLLAERYLTDLPLRRALSSYLVELRNVTKATIEVSLLVRGYVLAIDRLDGPGAGVFREASRIRPALESAAGRLLFANADPSAQKEAHVAMNSSRVSDAALAQWKGPFVTLVHEGDLEVAVPVQDRDGTVVAALSATLIEGTEGSPEDLARPLQRAAEAVKWGVADA